uniref:splicing factor, suppressor of white-apricot homolog isoform X2 n=1 Tax=Myxine glutinosa TaxID=7769 RepID=UPI00358F0377
MAAQGNDQTSRGMAPEQDRGLDELLVFGYTCKLFRDDEKARFIDKGQHLIPWMGDDSLMIDRYDGRGHLHDLSDYDSQSTWNHDNRVTEEEARIDALCDEERYLALHVDLLEEAARQDEEYRRLHEALAEDGIYNSMGYVYSSDYYDPTQPTEEEANLKKEKASEEVKEDVAMEQPFIAPAQLHVTSDIELPATYKTHAIIERTAGFVSKQGGQFEIMLKAKQSGNTQFDFLNFEHYLNPYYKHILKLMKKSKYVPVPDPSKPTALVQTDEDDTSSDDEGGDYLHPSLFASKSVPDRRLEEIVKPLKMVDPTHPILALTLKACRSSQLKAQAEMKSNVATPPAATCSETTIPQPVSTVVEAASSNPVPSSVSEPPATSQENLQDSGAEASTSACSTEMLAAYYGYYVLPDGSYVPVTTATASYDGYQLLPPPPPPPEVYDQHLESVGVNAELTDTSTSAFTVKTLPGPSDAMSISQLPPTPNLIPPPPDVQPVIDKLAQYVAKNGRDFELSVMAKNDTRFEFLKEGHHYNAYYEFKKKWFIEKEGGDAWTQKPVETTETDVDSKATTNGSGEETVLDEVVGEEEGEKKEEEEVECEEEAQDKEYVKVATAPITFTIRCKEPELMLLEKTTAFLGGDSSEEEEAEETRAGNSTGNAQGAALTVNAGVLKLCIPGTGTSTTVSTCASTSLSVAAAISTAVPALVTTQAMICEEKKPQPSQDELDARLAKQRLEARLAAAAREKLAQASKEVRERQALQCRESRERQLQADRKKKAELFLQKLKTPAQCEAEAQLPLEQFVQPDPPLPCRLPVVAPARNSPVLRVANPPSRPAEKVASIPEAELVTSLGSHRRRKHEGESRGKRKKKKSKKESSHSRMHSHSKTKHSLPSAYRSARQSRSPSPSTERINEDTLPSAYRVTANPEPTPRSQERHRKHPLGSRPHSQARHHRSRSPCMPTSPPSKHAGRPSSGLNGASEAIGRSPARSFSREWEGSDSPVLSSLQTKITQDIMAKVKAMLVSSQDSSSLS